MLPPSDYQYIHLEGVKIAYRVQGTGPPMLLVHGFASFSYTWQPLIECLAQSFTFYTIDMKGFGYSEKKCDDQLSPFDQAKIISGFIRHFDLHQCVLVGHSMGGAASSIAMFDSELRQRVSSLILVDSAGFFQELPSFIDELQSVTSDDPMLHLVNENLLADIILTEVYCDVSKITPELVENYGQLLRQEGARECLVAAARQVGISNVKEFHKQLRRIDLPTLIIWGEEDHIIDVEDAFYFAEDIPDSTLKIIPACGHSPQEERPKKTAAIITAFLADKHLSESPSPTAATSPMETKKSIMETFTPQQLNSPKFIRKLRMRHMIDHWNIGTVLFILFIKGLQLLRGIGFKAKENGWRKASSIFFRHEHTKFCLASFRLDYQSETKLPQASNLAEAKSILLEQLAGFLSENPSWHWKIQSSRFRDHQKKQTNFDMIEVEFTPDGELKRLIPHFDSPEIDFPSLNDNLKISLIQEVVDAYNHFKRIVDQKRRRPLSFYLRRQFSGKSLWGRPFSKEIKRFVERILSGIFIHFEVLPSTQHELETARVSTPPFEKRSNAGSGLINICCRFTHDFKEADLWAQFHHASVDAAPMQRTLSILRSKWGLAGTMLFPAPGTQNATVEIRHFGNDIYRGRIFLDFSQLLKIRKRINQEHYLEMGGNATIASMLIWGLAHFDRYRHYKFVLPVDRSDLTDLCFEKNLSLVLIRPGKYITGDHLEDFLKFERAFNQHLFKTRLGKCEMTEFMALIALNHPILFQLAKYLMPKALGEFVGTACFSIIKDAEIFVAPISDLQTHGFISLGSLNLPASDQNRVGAVSVCGTKTQVEEYLQALQAITENFQDFIQ